MKVLIVFACLAACAFATTLEWTQFKAGHNKTYKSLIEERLRYKIFQDNLKEIAEHNAKFEQGLTTYKKGVNQFADMTGSEFLAFLKLSGAAQKPKTGKVHKNTKAAPEEVDWRDSGAVTPIKDQGSCGSCWSFSATGSLEGQAQIQGGDLVSLSEQNLVDCSTANAGCNGGLMTLAYDYIEKNGIEAEDSYPYTGRDGTCKADSSKVVQKVSGYVEIKEDDEDDLIDALGNVGPIAVAIDATSELQLYSSGVFDDKTCSKNALNHGVLAVAYDGDVIVVKNSWGKSWGESGYVRFKRGKNLCGIASMACYPTL